MELRHDRCIVGRNEALENFRSCRRPYRLRTDIVLNCARNSCEERALLSRRNLGIHAIRFGKGCFARLQEICTDLALNGIHACTYILDQFTRRDLLARQHIVKDMRRFFI